MCFSVDPFMLDFLVVNFITSNLLTNCVPIFTTVTDMHTIDFH